MKRTVNVKYDIDPSVTETEIIIRTNEETEFTRNIASLIRDYVAQNETERIQIEVFKGNNTKSIDQEDILRVFIEDRKLIVETIQDRYQARCPLQALEEILDPESFLRISRSEIINLDYVSGFDMSIKGTIKVLFEDDRCSWVSRRYVNTVQKRLADLARIGGVSDE